MTHAELAALAETVSGDPRRTSATVRERGAPCLDIRFSIAQCTLGAILVAATERGLCTILLGDYPDRLVRALRDRFPHANLIGADGEFEQYVAKVVGFVEVPAGGLDLPLDIHGTAFQQRVWQALKTIPPGTTTTYAEIARRIGAPNAVRAVGAACAAIRILAARG